MYCIAVIYVNTILYLLRIIKRGCGGDMLSLSSATAISERYSQS